MTQNDVIITFIVEDHAKGDDSDHVMRRKLKILLLPIVTVKQSYDNEIGKEKTSCYFNSGRRLSIVPEKNFMSLEFY